MQKTGNNCGDLFWITFDGDPLQLFIHLQVLLMRETMKVLNFCLKGVRNLGMEQYLFKLIPLRYKNLTFPSKLVLELLPFKIYTIYIQIGIFLKWIKFIPFIIYPRINKTVSWNQIFIPIFLNIKGINFYTIQIVIICKWYKFDKFLLQIFNPFSRLYSSPLNFLPRKIYLMTLDKLPLD